MHIEQQHLEAFTKYSGLGDVDKMTKYDMLIARNISLHAHFDGENFLRFMINKDIVDAVIGDVLFDRMIFMHHSLA